MKFLLIVFSISLMFSSCGVSSQDSSLQDSSNGFSRISIPITFHLGGSQLFPTVDKMRGVVSEMQRVYNQAGLNINPTFAKDSNKKTPLIDVFISRDGGCGYCGCSSVGAGPNRQFSKVNEYCRNNAWVYDDGGFSNTDC